MVSDKKIFEVCYIAIYRKWAPPPAGHVYWWIGIIWTILAESCPRKINKSGQWILMRFLKFALIFSFCPFAAPMCNGPGPFEQLWKMFTLGTFMWSYIKFQPVVWEEISFKGKVDARLTRRQQTPGHDISTMGTMSAVVLKWVLIHNQRNSSL